MFIEVNDLIEYFKSKDIDPGMGAVIMVRLMAECLVSKNKSMAFLAESVDYTAKSLAAEIHDVLRHRIEPVVQ